jgi:hypothetical protein
MISGLISEKIYLILYDFIVLNVKAQQFNDISNIFRRLQSVACQMLKHWLTTGVRDIGSTKEVLQVSDDTAEDLGNGIGSDSVSLGTVKSN